MIDIWQFAKTIERGLNKEEGIVFKVWTDVGSYDAGTRVGNKGQNTIPCLLRRVSSPVTTPNNGILVATENLVLDVAVPFAPPRIVASDPTQPVVQDIEDSRSGIYAFVELIREYLDNYFSTNRFEAFEIDGETYQCGFEHHLGEIGDSSIQAGIGQFVTFSVEITIHLVQNGLNSMSVKVFIDGEQTPFLTASPSRNTIKQSDIYAGQGSESKTLNTSTAFALEISAPATDSRVISEFIDYLLYGKKDVAHFVKVKMGEKTRLMYATFGDVSASVEGVLNVGTTITITPIADNPELLEYPDYFKVFKISLPLAEQEVTLAVETDGEFELHFGGEFYKEGGKLYDYKGTEIPAIKVNTESLLYDYDTEMYYTYITMVSDSTVVLTTDKGSIVEL